MARPFWLQGAFQDLAIAAFARMGEPLDASAGMFDKVSAAYLAVYWGLPGARIGKRVGDSVFWLDGTQQAIEPAPQEAFLLLLNEEIDRQISDLRVIQGSFYGD